MKLYEIAAEYERLLDAIEAGDIPEEAIADTLEAVQGEFESKADNIACMLKDIAADVAAIKEEEKRLAERRKAKERTYERVKDYLSITLQRSGVQKLETPRCKLSFRKSESVEILDADALIVWAEKNDDSLLTYSMPTINKTAVKKALAAGSTIDGAQIVTRQNIQIK